MTKHPAANEQKRKDWREELAAANINSHTLLATDYLNHFNEVVMLLDLIEDMPECLDEVAAWRPRSYEDHFRHSKFSHRSTALEAYAQAHPARRAALDRVVAQLEDRLLTIISRLPEASTPRDEIHRLLEVAGGIINGTISIDEAAAIDDLERGAGRTLRQDDIDSLFD